MDWFWFMCGHNENGISVSTTLFWKYFVKTIFTVSFTTQWISRNFCKKICKMRAIFQKYFML